MNRDRFKFRVWDNEDKLYIENDADSCYIEPNGKFTCLFLHGDDYSDDVEFIEDVTIEQCTGLKDRNGKLIFEGDVVREHFEDGGSIDKVVFYNELQCKWYTRYNFRCSLGDAAFWEFGHHISHKLEIIGNIHEDQFRNVTKKVEE